MTFKTLSLYIAILTGLSFCTQPNSNNKMEEEKNGRIELLIGTYTGSGSEGIYRTFLDIASERLTEPELVVNAENPSYLAISKNRERVFSVNETTQGGVSAFRWNQERTQLELINQQPSQGDYPCYVALHPEENLFAAGNYMTGTVLAYPVNKKGELASDPVVRQHEGVGKDTTRQEGPHAHCTIFSNDGKWLYAVDLGIDQIIKYPVDGQSIGEGSTAFSCDPGDGPRHLIFHPTQSMAFLINELSSTVFSLSLDQSTGDFKSISKVSTLPPRFKEANSCADIQISNDGKYLYASNRGHNSIAVIAVSESGELSRITNESVHGDWPRNFTLSPDIDNQFLIVANQKSNNVVVFERDLETGLPSYTGNEIEISQPVCLKF